MISDGSYKPVAFQLVLLTDKLGGGAFPLVLLTDKLGGGGGSVARVFEKKGILKR